MSDRLQRISDNAGRIYAGLIPLKNVTREERVRVSVETAILIEQEAVKQIGVAFAAPSKPIPVLPDPRPCTCEEVPGDHARCPIHGES